MKIPKKVIERAIEGGWKKTFLEPDKLRSPHWNYDGEYFVVQTETTILLRLCGAEIALDPSFWQALGTGLGNKEEMRCNSPSCDTKQCEYAGYKNPRRMYESFCMANWEGATEHYWNDLLGL